LNTNPNIRRKGEERRELDQREANRNNRELALMTAIVKTAKSGKSQLESTTLVTTIRTQKKSGSN